MRLIFYVNKFSCFIKQKKQYRKNEARPFENI